MYFTLAISAAAAAGCAALTRAALDTDPRVLPVPGPPAVAWRSADSRLAVIRWGAPAGPVAGATVAAAAGTIWASPEGAVLRARTGLARTDPVYVAAGPGAVVVSDRAGWAASVTGRLGDPDPVMIAALLNLGYPLGAATPFRGVVAGTIAARLGVEHVVTAPRPPGTAGVADVLARLRSAVLVADGMLSAFENVGLSPWAARFGRGPLRALDDFYLINRAGRWSAAARQAYLLRERLVQPFFDDRVVRAARDVPLAGRVSGRLHHDLLAGLCPDLLDVPLAGRGPATADWRRGYGDEIAAFLRGYVLDRGADLFDVVSRRAAERALRVPHADREAAWALATVAAQVSGDWLNARSP